MRNSLRCTFCSSAPRSWPAPPPFIDNPASLPAARRVKAVPQPRSTPAPPAPKVTLGKNRNTLWQSWRSLEPRYRLMIGFTAGAFAVAGIFTTDKLEQMYPARNNKSSEKIEAGGLQPVLFDREQERKPRLLGVTVVDREAR